MKLHQKFNVRKNMRIKNIVDWARVDHLSTHCCAGLCSMMEANCFK
jgi:hypothetical protein